MKKKSDEKLVWRLHELPFPSDLVNLFSAGLISKEEAREIMFKKASSKKEDFNCVCNAQHEGPCQSGQSGLSVTYTRG